MTTMSDTKKNERQRKAQDIVASLQEAFGKNNVKLTQVRLDDLVPKDKK
jgi:hypothetical protein